MALLSEGVLLEEGKEDRVAVDRQEIEVVLFHRAGRRVDGSIRIGQGIQVGGQAPSGHDEEGVLDWISP